MKKLLLILCLALGTGSLSAQLLFPESYVIIFDTTRHFKGAISPSVEVKTPKELYIEITNRADLAYHFDNKSLIVSNKFEFTKNGEETILSGGFVYLKYKTFYDNPFVMEYYSQYQWAEARGLERKYAVGANLRYKIYKNLNSGAFVGLGPFIEYEEWNYQAVPDDRLPTELDRIIVRKVKLNFYVSTKQTLTDKIKAEAAFYFQDGFTNFFEAPRLGSSVGISYAITPKVAFGVQYRMLYDFNPVVPVDKLWYNAFTQLEVTF